MQFVWLLIFDSLAEDKDIFGVYATEELAIKAKKEALIGNFVHENDLIIEQHEIIKINNF